MRGAFGNRAEAGTNRVEREVHKRWAEIFGDHEKPTLGTWVPFAAGS